MSKVHLSNKPKDLRISEPNPTGSRAWFYEEGKGILIIVEIPTRSTITGEMYKEFAHINISWRILLSSVGRYLRKK